MADRISVIQRSENMRRIRGRDTLPNCWFDGWPTPWATGIVSTVRIFLASLTCFSASS